MRSRVLAVLLAFGVCGGAFAQTDDGKELPTEDSAYLAVKVKSPGMAFLYSAALPGSGQLYVGTNRGFVYLAAEAALLVGYGLTYRSASNLRDDYFEEVRAGVTFDGGGGTDTWNEEDFEHATDFENWHNVYTDDGGEPIDRVGKFYWSDIGEFKDADPDTGDFIPDSALRLSAQNLRFQSNNRYKTARALLGALIFNHLVSAVDARLAAHSNNSKTAPVSLEMRPDGLAGSVSVALKWRAGF